MWKCVHALVLICPASLCLLVGEFNPFTFKVIINMSDISSVQFSCSVVPNTLWPHGLQHVRFPCPSLSPGVCSNSCPLSQGCYRTISSSVFPFSACLQSFPAPGSFPVSQLFARAQIISPYQISSPSSSTYGLCWCLLCPSR